MGCRTRIQARKHKLRLRYKDRIDNAIARTTEKLELLREIKSDLNWDELDRVSGRVLRPYRRQRSGLAPYAGAE